MKQIVKTLILMSSVIILASCAPGGVGRGVADGEAYPQDAYGVADYGVPDAYAADRDPRLAGQVRGGPTATLEERVVYFDFDSAEIRTDARPVLEAHARYLASNPATAVVLEGHTDERGTREYNIGLGERRADAVRRLMVAFGVTSQQLRLVSYGEERPAVAGNDETSYAQNRRVEIVYL